MTDAKKPPQRPAPTGSAASPRPSAPSAPPKRAMTATRSQPLTATRSEEKVQDRLKSGASNALLNALGAARDAYADFQAANRFFKYKAFIVAGWVALTVLTLFIARPGSDGPDNDLDAKLVVTQTPGSTIYMVKNEGMDPWKNVVIEVNGQFKTTARPELQANDGITLTPKILVGPDGKLAPPTLQIRDVVVRTSEGTTLLLENGELP